jgi:hypothetical protein
MYTNFVVAVGKFVWRDDEAKDSVLSNFTDQIPAGVMCLLIVLGYMKILKTGSFSNRHSLINICLLQMTVNSLD